VVSKEVEVTGKRCNIYWYRSTNMHTHLHLKIIGFNSIMVLLILIAEGIPGKILLLKWKMRDLRLINITYILKCNFLNPVNSNYDANLLSMCFL
jgi:hypothetical protein